MIPLQRGVWKLRGRDSFINKRFETIQSRKYAYREEKKL